VHYCVIFLVIILDQNFKKLFFLIFTHKDCIGEYLPSNYKPYTIQMINFFLRCFKFIKCLNMYILRCYHCYQNWNSSQVEAMICSVHCATPRSTNSRLSNLGCWLCWLLLDASWPSTLIHP